MSPCSKGANGPRSPWSPICGDQGTRRRVLPVERGIRLLRARTWTCCQGPSLWVPRRRVVTGIPGKVDNDPEITHPLSSMRPQLTSCWVRTPSTFSINTSSSHVRLTAFCLECAPRSLSKRRMGADETRVRSSGEKGSDLVLR
jgi:hypothetical protein